MHNKRFVVRAAIQSHTDGSVTVKDESKAHQDLPTKDPSPLSRAGCSHRHGLPVMLGRKPDWRSSASCMVCDDVVHSQRGSKDNLRCLQLPRQKKGAGEIDADLRCLLPNNE